MAAAGAGAAADAAADAAAADGVDREKLDRQLRLWGVAGQLCLMRAHVLFVGAGPTATESAKDLVLPGIGEFTVLDAQEAVTRRDCANNFFVEEGQVGQEGLSRAQAVVELLTEMNPDVTGHARCADIATVVREEPEWFDQFTLVVAATQCFDASEKDALLPLAELCWAKGMPLVVARSYGLIGYVRVQCHGHSVVEAKPDQEQDDLRITDPFPELQEYIDAVDMDTLDSAEHGHVPYVVILAKCIAQWREAHDGELPKNFEEKDAFKATVKAASRDFGKELNFQDAYTNYYKAYTPREIPYELMEMLDADRSAADEKGNLPADASAFDFLLRALRLFLEENNNVAPLSGKVPDMTATTERFIQLQRAYGAKAARDRADMRRHLTALEAAAGRDASAGSVVSDEALETFCKNVYLVQKITARSLKEERESPAKETVMMAGFDPYDDAAQTPIHYYVALRAVDRFRDAHGRFPGEQDDQVVEDSAAVWALMQELSQAYEAELPEFSESHAQEITRVGAAEVHNIAAIVGGVVSQEVVKLLTHQYVPLNNTYVFNGVASVGAVYEL